MPCLLTRARTEIYALCYRPVCSCELQMVFTKQQSGCMRVSLVLGSGKRTSFWWSYGSIIYTCFSVLLPFQVKNILVHCNNCPFSQNCSTRVFSPPCQAGEFHALLREVYGGTFVADQASEKLWA